MGIFTRRAEEGAQDKTLPQGDAQLHLLQGGTIGKEEIAKAVEILTKYKSGKSNLEKRLIEDELWWELRHWETLRRQKNPDSPTPSSAWLFNTITNKHADAMDNAPEPIVLPREASDKQSAQTLSSVLPVVMEYNDFEQVYSNNWYEKLKHGTGVYGVFWDPKKENGLGDISIQEIDLLNIFWEPGITDIQDSRNLFITRLVDEDLLDAEYPQYAGKMGGRVVDVAEYVYDDHVDTEGKSLVVDWYYKKRTAGGKTAVHYVKFVGDCLLYASENDPAFAQRGYYDHGQYPVEFDALFPEKGTPVGFGFVSVCKDPQLYIDQLSANILENAMMTTKKRFFVSESTAINEKEFLDWNTPLVHVASNDLEDRKIREIVTQPLSAIYPEVLQMKIEEMKDTASNRDVNSGGTSNVTAASAIAALQEAGNKVSRDMIAASYRKYARITQLCIELMRQFYDVSRAFRITGNTPGEYEFVYMNNQALKNMPMRESYPGQYQMHPEQIVFRQPIFDIKIKAQKRSPFSKMEQNERAKELYGLGFFNPENSQSALGALKMMDFEGKEDVEKYVQQGQTLMNLVQQLATQVQALTQAVTGVDPASGEPVQAQEQSGGGKSTQRVAKSGVDAAKTNMTSYGQRLAKNSTPSLENAGTGAMPK